jgi:hypothetical protein
MKYRAFLMMMGLWLGVLACVQAEPKAYELVKYQGKAGRVKVAFDFADGYPEASEMKVTEPGGWMAKTFHLDDDGSGAVRFVPVKSGGVVQSVTLKMDLNDRAPATVAGSYMAGGKSVPFTLAKKK